MSTYRPVPNTGQSMRRFDYIVVCRIAGDPEPILLPYTVHAYSEAVAHATMTDLMRDEAGMIALVLCPSEEDADDDAGGAA